MKITTARFEESFFSIGGGFDIQPLLRFSHLCDFFINLNLFIGKDKVMAWYDKAFKYCDDLEVIEKQVIDHFDETTLFELNENYNQDGLHLGFMSPEDLQDYQNIFSNVNHANQFAIIYTLHRKSVNRTITFYYCAAEGLATYLGLSENGKYAPKVINTVQTGVLENPEGILNNFFKRPNKQYPALWIRGFEPKYDPFRTKNPSLDGKGLFNKKALDLNHQYTCGFSYENQHRIQRYCKAFVTEALYEKLAGATLKEAYQNDNHQIVFEYLGENPGRINPNDYIVLSKKTKISIPKPANLLYWEDFTSRPICWLYITSVSEQISKLTAELSKLELDKDVCIHLIPFCLEDEGISYVESIQALNFKTITYAPNVFDFIDLKTGF